MNRIIINFEDFKRNHTWFCHGLEYALYSFLGSPFAAAFYALLSELKDAWKHFFFSDKFPEGFSFKDLYEKLTGVIILAAILYFALSKKLFILLAMFIPIWLFELIKDHILKFVIELIKTI